MIFTIAASELKQITRNRSVLIGATAIPLGTSALLILGRDNYRDFPTGLGFAVGVMMVSIAALGLYVTAVTTLAARRETLFLKRLRSTAAGDASILTGLLAPSVLISAIQVTIVLGVHAWITEGPADPFLLALSGVLLIVLMLALALATVGVTRSPEHAQITTLPITLGAIGLAMWIGLTGPDDLPLVKALLPTGATTQLNINAWNGGTPLDQNLLLLLPTLGWITAALLMTKVTFHWEPRH
ncbi:ABC transporter permease [Microbacterium azadirachtae]|uniref:ABC-2 type transport system permease protein n=1 Tax=Microbacterium azadirachtae TaxID=582680 RepID=A0A1I6G530_9MICO|nr:ABC transporter permease [Microbacterium azadirachtae]SDL34463.1 ABC-2 type transport system permease protein [Microbacterium azadirachtae]SEF64951.1 ABC-2 type transport system permease protein [Microbacterium azadirachtae]SEF65808.1 ABC-2 type transport system permease protein [Microbacterium azadirachtae]SFR37299.1 ABC-2 type transport system permease protein [Microbacterium azadirachtae]